MLNYLIRRVFTSVLVLFGVSMLVFSVIHLVPGDVTMAILGRQKVSEEKVAELREQLVEGDESGAQPGVLVAAGNGDACLDKGIQGILDLLAGKDEQEDDQQEGCKDRQEEKLERGPAHGENPTDL